MQPLRSIIFDAPLARTSYGPDTPPAAGLSSLRFLQAPPEWPGGMHGNLRQIEGIAAIGWVRQTFVAWSPLASSSTCLHPIQSISTHSRFQKYVPSRHSMSGRVLRCREGWRGGLLTRLGQSLDQTLRFRDIDTRGCDSIACLPPSSSCPHFQVA